MKKSVALSIVLLILLATITGCRGNDAEIKSQDVESTYTSDIVSDEPDESITPSPEMHDAAVPAVFVNDTYFRIFDDRQDIVPDVDDTWVYLGKIQGSVPGWKSPTQNFQTNNEAMIGAEIFFSSEGRIPVTSSAWGDPIDEEIVGDIVIVVFEGSRLWYISEEAHSEVIEVMNAVVRHSLMVDGVIYSLMGTAGGGDFSLSDNHIFLGEVVSAVAMDEYPTENLQANRDSTVGAKVYRLPQGENSDLVVFFFPDARFYFKNLHGAE